MKEILDLMVKTLLLWTPLIASAAEPAPARWMIVNDGVMGGRSSSSVRAMDQHMRFTGMLSLENSGGFASCRIAMTQGALRAGDGVKLRVRGDGRCYQFRLKAHVADAGIAYRAEFCTLFDAWADVRLYWSEFKPTYRGSMLRGPPLDLTAIGAMGFMLADKRPGPFQLDVAEIGLIATE